MAWTWTGRETCQKRWWRKSLKLDFAAGFSGETRTLLDEISGSNGRCQDLRDAYSAVKGEYSQVWLSENRPYWLSNVTVRYDLAIEEWQRRGNRFRDAIRAFEDGEALPPPDALGLPAGVK